MPAPTLLRLARRWLAPTPLIMAAACGGDDPFRPVASLPNAEVRYSLFTLTGAPGLPAAIDLYGGRIVIPEVVGQSTNFDLAFDLDAAGRVRVLPTRQVAIPPSVASAVRTQVLGGTFEALTRAPTSGYAADSTRTLRIGEVLAVEMPTTGQLCFTGEPYYGKLVVDSIFPSARRLVIRTIINRNCGYRSLTVGLPTD